LVKALLTLTIPEMIILQIGKGFTHPDHTRDDNTTDW